MSSDNVISISLVNSVWLTSSYYSDCASSSTISSYSISSYSTYFDIEAYFSFTYSSYSLTYFETNYGNFCM